MSKKGSHQKDGLISVTILIETDVGCSDLGVNLFEIQIELDSKWKSPRNIIHNVNTYYRACNEEYPS